LSNIDDYQEVVSYRGTSCDRDDTNNDRSDEKRGGDARMKRVAFMFPGQGSQNVGIGKQFYDADPDVAEMFHQADQLLDKPLTNVMINGPKETLTATENG